MASYLLFVNGHHDQPGKQVLAEFGCGDLARGGEIPGTANIGDQGGPSGHAGLLIIPAMFADNRDPSPFYRRDQQTWLPYRVDDQRMIWVGWETANPPKPSDLLRESVVAGPKVTLRDGNEWMVPYCFAERWYYRPGDDGHPVRATEAKNQRLYDLAAPSYERLRKHYHTHINPDLGDSPWDNDAEVRTAVSLLAENYRLCLPAAIALGLFLVNDVPKVIAHATNWEHFVELQTRLKEQAAGGDSDGG